MVPGRQPIHMNSEGLEAFCLHVKGNPMLQADLQQVRSPIEILRLAERHGYRFSLKELRQASRDLCSPWWVWARRGHDWRRQFFAQDG